MREEKKIYFPLFASKDLNGGNQSEEESREVWNAVFALDDNRSSRLLSRTIAEALAGLEEAYQLPEQLVEYVTVITREFFFGKITQQQSLDLIKQKLGTLSSVNIDAIIPYIQQKVFMVSPDHEVIEEEKDDVVRPLAETTKLQILKAIAEYPNLGNQIISSERIRIKSQPEPVRGSLLNWIKYYRDELGIGQHSTVERGQFLFGSVNGKVLSSLERERVNIILKSLEENLPLEIDTERQEVIFPVIDTEASVQQLPVLPSQGEIQVMSQPLKTELPIPPAFVPQPLPSKQADQNAIARKFQPSPSPYQKISIPPQPLSPERMGTSNVGIDVSQMAEKLKREPKPEWIKGAFTKESIPDTAPVAKAVGSMSFSFNHALPAEQEVKSPKSTAPQISEQAPKPAVPVSSEPAVVSSGPIKEAVPPIASPRPRASQFHIRPVSQRD